MGAQYSRGALTAALLCVGLAWGVAQEPSHDGGSTAGWTHPRTSWGDPDLQGIWDQRTITPLERPEALADKAFLTDEDVAVYEQRAAARPDGRRPDDRRTGPSVHAPYWLDYGTRVVGSRRSSLVVDPSDGRIPPLTSTARQKMEGAASKRVRPAASWEDRSLWERCLTRGVPAGMLPGPYNNNLQIFQTPDYVVLYAEMIHDARIIPLDGHPHIAARLRQWMGDSRGHWEGDTLVVETTNFATSSSFRGAAEHLYLVERFRRVGSSRIDYAFTVTDPTTWTRPWTVNYPVTKTEGPVFEYACHEGNYAIQNILVNARLADKE